MTWLAFSTFQPALQHPATKTRDGPAGGNQEGERDHGCKPRGAINSNTRAMAPLIRLIRSWSNSKGRWDRSEITWVHWQHIHNPAGFGSVEDLSHLRTTKAEQDKRTRQPFGYSSFA
jgi:hypothetical protein